MKTLARIVATLAILTASLCTGILVVGSLRAVEICRQIDVILTNLDGDVAELHRATSKAIIEADPQTLQKVRDIRLRLAHGLTTLNGGTQTERAANTPFGTLKPVGRIALVFSPKLPEQSIQDAFRAYVAQADRLLIPTADTSAPTQELNSPLLDLSAQLLRQQVSGLRDRAEIGRSAALLVIYMAAVLAIVAMAVSFTGLIWLPRRSANGRASAAATPPPALGGLTRSSELVLHVDRQGIIRQAEGPSEQFFDRPVESLRGIKLIGLIYSGDVQAVQRFTAEAQKDPRGARAIECRARHADSRWYHLEVVAGRRKSDAPIEGVVVGVTDITDLKQAEEALRESSEMLRTLTEASPLAITIEDHQGRLKIWNAASERIFDWTPDEVLGGLNPTIAADAKEEHQHLRQRVLENQAFAALEGRRITKDGSSLDVSISVAPLRDAEGRIWGLMEVITDITERKQLQAQLLQAQKMESIGRLAGGIAHDFNNLLTAILGHADLLLHRPHAREADMRAEGIAAGSIRTGVEQIQKAAERASLMTQQLLAFSRNQVLQPTILDLNVVIADMEDMLRRLIGEDIDLGTVPSRNLDLVKADPTQISQVLMNLAVNARDAMPQGGKLTIETANVVLDEAYARKRMPVIPGPYVLLAVSDTGHGMDKDTQTRIFEPFFTTKERGKGTGLGLATVYGIVRQSGGYIWCYSERGHGACFKIYLPSAQVRSDAPTLQDRTPQPPPNGSETVLLVEDEEIVRTLVRQVLSWYGYQVIEARNGEEALKVAAAYHGAIDLLLTDLVMPGMSAVDMVKELAPKRPHMKILYMSGYTDHAVVRHNLLSRGSSFIQKPFAPDRLAHKVREVLNAPVKPWQPADITADRNGNIPTPSRT